MRHMNREPVFNVSEPLPLWVVGALVIVHLAVLFVPGAEALLYNEFALGAKDGDIFVYTRTLGPAASLIGHTLLHGDLIHLAMNSVFILVCGIPIIRAAGSGTRGYMIFAVFFVAGAVAGGLAEWGVWIASSGSGVAIGASSAASALLAGLAWVVGGRDTLLKWGFGYLILNAFFFAMNSMGSPLQIAWAAHIGGYAAGALLCFFLLPPSSTRMGL